MYQDSNKRQCVVDKGHEDEIKKSDSCILRIRHIVSGEGSYFLSGPFEFCGTTEEFKTEVERLLDDDKETNTFFLYDDKNAARKRNALRTSLDELISTIHDRKERCEEGKCARICLDLSENNWGTPHWGDEVLDAESKQDGERIVPKNTLGDVWQFLWSMILGSATPSLMHKEVTLDKWSSEVLRHDVEIVVERHVD